MSFGSEYLIRDKERLRAHIDGIHAAGDRAIPYTSAFYHASRNPDDYVTALRNLKGEYGIDGVFSDGLPGIEWLVAYEQMRMLRELFPDGTIIIHDTSDQSGRVAPCSFIHTYADRTFLAEGTVYKNDPRWPYPRYEVAQFRRANCFGDIQGDGWKEIGSTPEVDLLNLIYNGRVIAQRDWFESTTWPVVQKLKAVWEKHGTDPYFYDRYYLPAAHRFTGLKAGRCGMPIVTTIQDPSGAKAVTLDSESPGSVIYFTTDGTEPSGHTERYTHPISLRGNLHLRALALTEGLEPSRTLSIHLAP